MIGCYANTRSGNLWTGSLFEYLGNSSGLIHWQFMRTARDWAQSLDLTYYSDLSINSNSYAAVYKAVNSCNKFIEGVTSSPVDDETFKREEIAEARLLRALLYFTAVRMWGDVPLLTHSTQTVDEMHVPRTSYLEVYRMILEDLKVAECDMRDYDRVVELTGYTGRMDRWAATALKAKVYVQIGSILGYPDYHPFTSDPDFTACGIPDARTAWQLALETCERIMLEGPYELESDYRRLFRWTDPEDFRSRERIITLQTTENGTKESTVIASRTIPQYFVGTSHYTGSSSNSGRIRPSRFLFQKWAKTYGGELDDASKRQDRLPDVYINCKDPRFDATYIYMQMETYNGSATQTRIQNIYPSDRTLNRQTLADSKSVNCMPYFRKYVDPKYSGGRGNADFYLLRYADIYLMAAEAAAELSVGPGDLYWQKAFDYIEVIHRRARQSVIPEAEQPRWESDRFQAEPDPKQALIDALMFERFYELHGEGHEWFDIRRKGADFLIRNLTHPLNEFNQQPSQQPASDEMVGFWQVSYLSHIYPETPDEIRRRLLCAFPADEIRVNQSISEADQNPYYVE